MQGKIEESQRSTQRHAPIVRENESQHSHAHSSDKPTSNKSASIWRWVWLIVAVLAIVAVFMGISRTTEELAQIGQVISAQTETIQDQTDVLKEQNQILTDVVRQFDQLFLTIREAINDLIASFSS